MISKKYFFTVSLLSLAFSFLVISATLDYNAPKSLDDFTNSRETRKNPMNLIYSPGLLQETDLIIGGAAVSTAFIERFAASLSEEKLQDYLYTRKEISEKDEQVSYALQLLGEEKLESTSDTESAFSLYKKAWLINPKNEEVTRFIGASRRNFGDFIDVVQEYQTRTTGE